MEPVVPDGTTVSGATCTDAEKKALIRATRELSLLEYDGSRVDAVQKLSWPRSYAPNPDLPTLSTLSQVPALAYFEEDEIPDRVVQATIQLALGILAGGTTDIFAVDESVGVIEETVDVLTTKWDARVERPSGLERYPAVVDLIRPLLADDAGVLGISRQ